MLKAMYLGAVVAANLLILRFGPSAAIPVAFLFIGLDLTTRDFLHESWHGKKLVLKMGTLILAGSVLSALVNWNAAQIAVASFVAFACAGITDFLVYQILHGKEIYVKITGSNIISSAVDSAVFPALAFGFPLLWKVMLGQFVAKVLGGFLWGIIIANYRR